MKGSGTRLALRIALTHLLSKKKQTFIAMMGVTFGISMFIVMISFMQGINDFFMDLTLDGSPHIRIYNPAKTDRPPLLALRYDSTTHWLVVRHQRPKNEAIRLKKGVQMLNNIRQMPEVQQASPQLASQAFFHNGPIEFAGNVVGIDVKAENQMYKLYEKMEAGSVDKLLTNREGIMIGERLAAKLNVAVGDRVSVTMPNGSTFLLKVVGIFSFGISTIDDTRSYVQLQTAQKMLARPSDYFTDLHIRLKNYRVASALAPGLEQLYGYRAETWEVANASIEAGEMIRNVLTLVVSLTMLVVAGFGIYNIMNMTIVNKMRDIAILKATGFESRQITNIFLLQSLIIGISGGLLGLAAGALISYGIDQIPFPARDIIKLDTFPINYRWYYYAAGLLFGAVTTVLAGYFPSRKAAKVDPVAIIRG